MDLTNDIGDCHQDRARRKTTAEQLFERYLANRGFAYQYEMHNGRRQPDYRVQYDGATMILEVKEFHDPAIKPSGGFSVVPAIRSKIHDARRQLAEYKEHACGVVLHNLGSIYRVLDIMSVASACFGQYFRLEPSTFDGRLHPEAPTFAFFGKAEMTRRQNTSISAVMILAHYRLDELWVATWRKLWAKQERGLLVEPKDQFDTMQELESSIRPRYRYEGSLRVIALHNPYARIPVPHCLFNSPFDQNWAVRDGRYELVGLGPTAEGLYKTGVPYACL